MKKLLFTFFSFCLTAGYAQNFTQVGPDVGGYEFSQSGYSVSMPDENTMAVGGPYYEGGGVASGYVQVYTWNGTAWVQKGIDIDGEAKDDYSGKSVALSSDGNTLAIGAFLNNSNNGFDAGQVRMYNWNGTAWVQKEVDIDGEAVGDQSGVSVALSSDGMTLAIGAPNNDGKGPDAGHVRVYGYNCTKLVGINEEQNTIQNMAGINLYPNPNNGNFTITCNEDVQLSIINIMGQQVYNVSLLKGQHELNLNNQANGIYLVNVNSPTNQGSLRLVIQH